MHVWAMARARATIGGPSFDSRTHWRNASFQARTTLSCAGHVRRAAAATPGTPDNTSTAPPAPAAVRNSRRDTALPNGKRLRTSFEGRSDPGFIARPDARSCMVKERGAERLSPRARVLLIDVEDCPVRVHSADRVLNGVVGLVTLRRRDALEDARRRTGPMTTHRENARLPVRELDPQDGGAVGPRAQVADVVDERWGRALEIGHHEGDQFLDLIGPAAGVGLPGASAGNRPRATITARGRNERAGSRQRDRVAVRSLDGRRTTRIEGSGGRSADEADDVPSHVVRPAGCGRERHDSRDD